LKVSLDKYPPYYGWSSLPRPDDGVSLVEYRRPGQRGRPSIAYLPAAYWDPEAAKADLVGFVGKIDGMRLVGIVRLNNHP
jgi:hypothetical protein